MTTREEIANQKAFEAGYERLRETLPTIWSYDLYDDGMSQVGDISNSDHIQGKWLRFEDVEHLHKVDRANADLVTQANRLDVMCIEKSALIQKLKNDVEIITDRRNKLIAEKSETIAALWNLVNSLPPSLQCIDFPHHEDDVHFGPCHKVAKYMEAKEKAEEIINKFTRKPKP